MWLKSAPNGTFATSVSVIAEKLPAAVDRAEYLALSMRSLKRISGSNDYEDREAGGEIDGNPFASIEWVDQDRPEPIRLRAVLVLDEGVGYNVSLAAAAEGFEVAAVGLEWILSAWTWRSRTVSPFAAS